MKKFEYWWNVDGQFVLSDPCIQEAEDAFRGNDTQPLLDILEETSGKSLPASLSTLCSNILTGKIKGRQGVPKQYPLTHTQIIMIGCLVRDLRASGAKQKYALQDVAAFFNPDPDFERRVAELDSLRDSAGLPMISLTRVKLAYNAFQAIERKRNQSLSKMSSSAQ